MNHAKNIRSSLLLVLAVLVALGVASRTYFGRLDLSEGRIFTLSPYSKHVVASLGDPITVKVFFSEDVGPQYNQNRVYLRDILEDYKSWSKGNFQFEMVDPREKEAFESEARKYRIQPVQAQAVENDQLTVKLVYMGLAFLAGDKTETIPFLGEVSGLEYLITGTIRRLSVDELPVVGVLQGHGEPELTPGAMPGMPGQAEGLNLLGQALSQDYSVQPVDLPAVEAIDPAISTLLWVAPREPVAEAELYKIDQFLLRGGRLGLFFDGVQADLQTRQATPLALGLAEFFAHYGLRLNSNLIADARCGSVQMRQGGGGLMSLFAISLKYPPFVEVRDFDADSPVSRDLEQALLFFPSSLDTSAFAAARAAGATVSVLARSSQNSEIQMAPGWNLEPVERLDRDLVASRFTAGPQVLAASVEGAFASRFGDEALPEGVDPGDPRRLRQGTDCRIALVGDGNFVVDGYAQAGNLLLAQNIVDWLSLDDGLISIRAKTIASRPIKELSPGAIKWVKWLNILGVPLLVVLFGLLRWSSRRRRAELA
jgi:gliding-associated putative ABC transporter substrate-binding component GldG